MSENEESPACENRWKQLDEIPSDRTVYPKLLTDKSSQWNVPASERRWKRMEVHSRGDWIFKDMEPDNSNKPCPNGYFLKSTSESTWVLDDRLDAQGLAEKSQ